MRRYVERILSPRYELNVAMDGEAALTVARQYPPDLVLADVMMPRLDGFELLQALHADARTRDVPVILLSARAGEESRVEGLERGAADYLVKPFSARELLARIDARLEIARLHRSNVAREQRLRTAAEQSEARMHDELVEEIEAMNRLHELSTRWLTNMGLEALLEDMLDSTIQLVKADFGNLQLLDTESGTLRMVAQRGFTQEFLDYFNLVEEGTAACGLALQRRARVIVENVLTDPCFARHLHVVRAAAFQSMQSTPLISRKGEVLGVLSTHFREPRQLCARELRLLDLYARQAAELIERRQAEEKLRRSEERFRRYFDLGLIGGALTSPDKGCLEVNDELCRMLGYEREELLRKNWADMTHPDDLAADIKQFERVIASEIEGYRLDKRWIRSDGTTVDSIMAARAVRREDGTVDYLVGLVLDITARKRAEEALQRLQADLEHVWRIATIGEMASWIAHELTQPLAATIANANACACWLANEPKNVHEANAAVTRIVRDATRASQVIARIRALVTRREMERTPFHLGEVIGETVSIAEVEIRRHGVSLSCKVTPDLPQVVGDRVHVEQVILNLLRNAVEAMEPVLDRERLLVITVDALTEESLRVAVRDSGTGLPRQQRERVFDAFHSTKPAGMGMGLAISRSIVEAHGGRLWVTDNDGPGVTFQFTLPSAEAPELVDTVISPH
jgi:PAS domain S-box-containing protein